MTKIITVMKNQPITQISFDTINNPRVNEYIACTHESAIPLSTH